jgi:hypothetical protein
MVAVAINRVAATANVVRSPGVMPNKSDDSACADA